MAQCAAGDAVSIGESKLCEPIESLQGDWHKCGLSQAHAGVRITNICRLAGTHQDESFPQMHAHEVVVPPCPAPSCSAQQLQLQLCSDVCVWGAASPAKQGEKPFLQGQRSAPAMSGQTGQAEGLLGRAQGQKGAVSGKAGGK